MFPKAGLPELGQSIQRIKERERMCAVENIFQPLGRAHAREDEAREGERDPNQLLVDRVGFLLCERDEATQHTQLRR